MTRAKLATACLGLLVAAAPLAAGTWGKHLNPKGDAPLGKYRAFYISTKNPRKVVATEDMDMVQVKYAWAELHGIPSEEFGGYWVGRFRFDEDTVQTLSVALGHAQVRVLIDGEQVLLAKDSESHSVHFSKGEHTIEVEYLNRWHTTEFRAVFQTPQRTYTTKEARKLLAEALPKGGGLWYASVYEPGRGDGVVRLRLARPEAPVALVLSSYSAVTWQLEGDPGENLAAVVFGSYEPGTLVRVPGGWDVGPPLQVKGLPRETSIEPSYERHGDYFHVEDEGIAAVTRGLARLTTAPLRGFSGAYDPEELQVPETVLDAAKNQEIRGLYEAMERARNQGPRGVDDLFGDDPEPAEEATPPPAVPQPNPKPQAPRAPRSWLRNER